MDLKGLSSNWKKLQQQLKQEKTTSTSADTKPSHKRKQSHTSKSAVTGHDEGIVKKRRRTSDVSSTSRPEKTQAARVKDTKIKKRKMDGETEEVNQKLAETKISSRRGSSASLTKTVSNKSTDSNAKVNEGLSKTAKLGKYIAIDCEMVGVGPNPDRDSSLARVSVVNYDGDQIYDSYVQQQEEVTDWRTHVSGITPKHMLSARPFSEVQREISNILDGRVLVGHAVRNDLDALMLGHPKRDIRDTARHPAYKKIAGGGSPKLKMLASALLGIEIQGAAHSSLEDARATMMLYRRDKDAFEREHSKRWPMIKVKSAEADGTGEEKKKRKSKKKKKSKK